MNYQSINNLLEADINQLNSLITAKIKHSDSGLIYDIADYILSAGGKRLRPLILLLTANMFNDQQIDADKTNCIKLAAVLELIHTATLLHDDIIDNSAMRRNKTSAHLKWGIRNSVTIGDWLFSLAFELVVSTKNKILTEIVSDMTNTLARGELTQLNNKINYKEITVDDYFLVIEQKTALLFAVATKLAAVAARQPDEIIKTATDYGLYLGLSFQIVDDILDYLGDANLLGKNLGDDLLEGKMTLPMIYLRNQDPKYFEFVLNKIKAQTIEPDDFIELKNKLLSTGAIAESYQQARLKQQQALECLEQLPNNLYRAELDNLTRQIVARDN